MSKSSEHSIIPKGPGLSNVISTQVVLFLSQYRSRETQRAYATDLRIFLNWLGALDDESSNAPDWVPKVKVGPVLEVSKPIAQLYHQHLRTCPGEVPRDGGGGFDCTLSANSIARRLATVRGFFSQLVESDVIAKNPFSGLTERTRHAPTKRSTTFIPPEDVRALFEVVRNGRSVRRQQDRAILATLFYLALRNSEVISLLVGSIDPKRRTITIIGKGNKMATLPISDQAWECIGPWWAHRTKREGAKPHHPLFKSFKAKDEHTPLGRNYPRSMLIRLCKVAGITTPVTPHTARASAITQLLNLGYSHRDVKEFSRHSNIATVELYDKRRLSVSENAGRYLSYEGSGSKGKG